MDSKYTTCSVSENDLSQQPFFSPKRATFKYVGFSFMCFLCFGSNFCYDNPGALQDKFDTELKLPASEFVILYSVYSWPNVFLCLIGGFLLDRVFGIRWGTIIYATLTLGGQILFATGAYMDIFWIMILGRLLFGTGSESLIVAQTSYAVLWCSGKALNTLIALQLSFNQMGLMLNSIVTEEVYEFAYDTITDSGPECIGVALFVAAIPIFGSMVCAVLLGCMDNNAKKALKQNEDKESIIIKLTDVKDFKRNFWLAAFANAAFHVAVFPYLSLGKLFFMEKYGLEPEAANIAISVFYVFSVLTSPLFGMLIDKVGRNSLWLVVSIIGSLIGHGLLSFTYVTPYFCNILLGTSYSLFFTSLYPMIGNMAPERRLGTAYGISQALLNVIQAVMSILCGIIIDNYGYLTLEIFFLAWLFISLIPAVIIWM